MSRYLIADLVIDIKTKYGFTPKIMADYAYCGKCKTDFSVIVTDSMINAEKEISNAVYSDDYCETLAVLRSICREILSSYDGFLLHCSSLVMDGRGYIFTAPSGTGKSTHSRLWRERFGSRVKMINDDKPFLRRENGRFFIYGSPWQGKENIGNNIKAPVSAICVLKQGKENKIAPLEPVKALCELMNQTELPKDRRSMENLLDLFDGLLKIVPVYTMECTISQEAAEIAYNAMKTTPEQFRHN